MKIFSNILFILFITVSMANCQNLVQNNTVETVRWYTFEEALKLNKEKPKKIMIDVYTDWCGWCKKMDRETFINPVIVKYLNENFYPVKFNAESKEPIEFDGKKYVNEGTGSRSSHQFAIALLNGQLSYPSIAYFTEKLVYLGAVPGYKTPDQLEVWLNYIVSEKYFAKITFDDFQKTFVGKIKP
jgi:thioredoxin-related protein